MDRAPCIPNARAMKVLMPLPLAYDGTEARYLQRDGARFCGYLSDQGVEAVKLLVDDGSGFPRPKSPLLDVATWGQWTSAAYWKASRPDLVLLYGGLQRRLEPVVAAIGEAGIPVGLKMDSKGGVVEFPRHSGYLFRTQYFAGLRRHGRAGSIIMALRHHAAWVMGCHTAFLKRYLARFDIVTVEHEFALNNTRDWLLRHECPEVGARLRVLHHPVPEAFTYRGLPPKRRTILAIAMDWTNPGKGGALLVDALAEALPRLDGYSAVVVGTHSEAIVSSVVRRASPLGDRIRALPLQAEEEVRRLYCESRTLLMTSGSEGSPNVVSESACCGCSVVFPPELRQLSFLVEAGAGCMATSRSSRAMAQALVQDAEAWERGDRDPTALSTLWCGRFHVGAATCALLGFFGLALPDAANHPAHGSCAQTHANG